MSRSLVVGQVIERANRVAAGLVDRANDVCTAKLLANPIGTFAEVDREASPHGLNELQQGSIAGCSGRHQDACAFFSQHQRCLPLNPTGS